MATCRCKRCGGAFKRNGGGIYCSNGCYHVQPRGSPAERFLRKVKRWHSCWRWVGARMKNGYGRFVLNRFVENAHRAAYKIFVGPIPDGLQINHHCGHRWCVNPAHIYAGTQTDNMQDAISRGRFDPVGTGRLGLNSRWRGNKPTKRR